MLAKFAILIGALCVIGAAVAEQSPVFLWGANSPSKPSLKSVTQPEFANIIAPLLKDHMIVAFQEDGLASTDFVCHNADTAKSCYAHLQGVTPKTYYASVENPVDALRSLTQEREFNSVDATGKLDSSLTCSAGKVVFINFDSHPAERGEILESHDAAISAITNENSCPTVYLYMASPSTTSVVKIRERRATAAQQSNYMFNVGSQFLIFWSNLTYSNNGAAQTPITIQDITATNLTTATNGAFNITMTSTDLKQLNYTIIFSGGYFAMVNIYYDNVLFYNNSLNAPTGFSFACGNLTLSAYSTPDVPNTSVLYWNSLQFQTPATSQNGTFVFGDSWDCTPFFTPGILGGLFVVIILLSILFIGVCWMMDMNTMDRFDDPKGKTITINAGE